MRDEDDRHAELLLQRLHEVQNLRLDGDVERGGGLVGDQDIGLAGQRHGDHDALAHTAGEFVGILLHALFRLVDIDEAEHLDRAVPRLLAVAVGVQGNGFHQLVADGVGRVEGGHRILEDDRDLVAAHMLHHVLACADELLPVELDGAGDDLARGGEDLHDGIRGHGFAGAGFADDAEHLALVKEEGHAVDGLDLACVGEKGGMEILYFK